MKRYWNRAVSLWHCWKKIQTGLQLKMMEAENFIIKDGEYELESPVDAVITWVDVENKSTKKN